MEEINHGLCAPGTVAWDDDCITWGPRRVSLYPSAEQRLHQTRGRILAYDLSALVESFVCPRFTRVLESLISEQ